MKNRNHQFKRVISNRKFSRILSSNLDKTGFAYITRKNWEIDKSLEAVKIDNIVYARFATKNKENRLDSYCIRYKIEEGFTEDWIAFFSISY